MESFGYFKRISVDSIRFQSRVAQSVQRLATGWTVRGSNTGGGEIFFTCPDRPCGPPSFLYNGYRVFPGGKERPGRDADPSPSSSAMVMKEQSYTSTPPMGRTACTEPQCLYKGDLYLLLQSSFYRTGIRRKGTLTFKADSTIKCKLADFSEIFSSLGNNF